MSLHDSSHFTTANQAASRRAPRHARNDNAAVPLDRRVAASRLSPHVVRAGLTAALLVALSAAAGCEDDSAGTFAGTTVTSSSASGSSSAGQGGASQGGAGPVGGEGGAGGMVDPSASPGCIDGEGIAEGESTFMLNGETRRYIVYPPKNYNNNKAWPLVLALHPNGGNIDYWNNTSGERNIRELVEDDAILILAEDITNNWPDDLDTELSYFETIVSRAKNELCVDTDEIFSMGFSGGGSFSGVLGCRRSDIRAIVSGGAIIYFDENDCVNQPAAWVTIGKGELVPAREAFRDFWRDGAMCASTTTPVAPDPCELYDSCAPDKPVHYCEHNDGHIWPAFGTAAAWSFFQQFID